MLLALIVLQGFGCADNDPEELSRKAFQTIASQPVPQTDTGSREENSQVLE